MAQTWRSKHLQVEQAADDALREGLLSLIGPITRVLLRYATDTNEDGQRILPYRPRVLEQVSRDIWKEALKPWFIGGGDRPLDEDGRPRSPYMDILVGGIVANTRLSAEETVALIKKRAASDIFDWLTGPRPIGALSPSGTVVQAQGLPDPRKLWYDPFHKYIGAEDGYTLSDRGWRAAEETRKAIDNLLAAEVAKGTAAVDIADKLEPYLWPEAAAVRTVTPYGEDGSYWARRLARTEITAAAGRSLHNAALANVYVSGIKWNLSLSHPCCDICDQLAAGGENGDGVYPKDDVPLYPAHPHCLCYLTQELTDHPRDIEDQIRVWIEEEAPEAVALRGAFNPDWLTGALLNGDLIGSILDNEFVSLQKLLDLARGAAEAS